MLLSTDGLVDGRAAPGSAERFGPHRLAAHATVLAAEHGAREELVAALLARATDANGGPLADDVAVLMVQPRD